MPHGIESIMRTVWMLIEYKALERINPLMWEAEIEFATKDMNR
jgi:hypothetical protein